MRRPALPRLVLVCALAVPGVLYACVGDDPVTGTPNTSDSGTNSDSDASSAVDSASPIVDASDDTADVAKPPAEMPNAVATGVANPLSIAVTSNSIAILTATSVLRCPLKNCTVPAEIAVETVGTGVPYAIDADENDVHWFSQELSSSSRYYYKCPLAGCYEKVPTRRYADAFSLESPTSLAIGADGLVRISQKFDVTACGNAACSQSGCVSADAIKAFAFDGTTLFWSHTTDPGGLYKCTPGVTGSNVQLHATAGTVVTAYGDQIYTMTTTGITTCAKAGCGGQPTPFVTSEAGLSSMVVTPDGVFWSSSGSTTAADGAIKTCPLSGCSGSIRIVATGQAQPTSLRYREGTLYWANRGTTSGVGGAIMRAGAGI